MEQIKKTPAREGFRYEHPAMGAVSFSRVTTTGQNLFGSSIRHDHYIVLKIAHAVMDRHLSNDWLHPDTMPLIEIALSPAQFAELLTTMNTYSGVPCTLTHFNGKAYKMPQMETKAEQFHNEIKNNLTNALSGIEVSVNKAEEYLNRKTTLNKTEKAELMDITKIIKRFAEDHLPFILEQFEEQMEKTVVEAKSAIDSFVLDTITKTGIEALRDQNIKMLDGESK